MNDPQLYLIKMVCARWAVKCQILFNAQLDGNVGRC